MAPFYTYPETSSPDAGAELGEVVEVAWEAFDPDTPAELLLYQVAYSPDGGDSWVPIAVDIPGTVTAITFDATTIRSTDGASGLLRVFVSDGLNTAFADVRGLTTLAAR